MMFRPEDNSSASNLKVKPRASLNSNCSNVQLNIPVPNDGGWGWMVVMGSFFNNLIIDGVMQSFGIFFIEFLDYFGGGRDETALIGGLLQAMYLLTGPIANALINVFGCRKIAIIGGLISTSGLILSSMTENLHHLYLTFGLVVGVGFGMVYLSSVVMVSSYFLKKRSLATGIVCGGSGFGSAVMPIFIKYLIEEYTWKGAVLIQAGVVLNTVVCSSLFVPFQSQDVLQMDINREQLENMIAEDVSRRSSSTNQDKVISSSKYNLAAALSGLRSSLYLDDRYTSCGVTRVPSGTTMTTNSSLQQVHGPGCSSGQQTSSCILFNQQPPTTALPSMKVSRTQIFAARKSSTTKEQTLAPTYGHQSLSYGVNGNLICRSTSFQCRKVGKNIPRDTSRSLPNSTSNLFFDHSNLRVEPSSRSHTSDDRYESSVLSTTRVYLTPLKRKDIFYSGSICNTTAMLPNIDLLEDASKHVMETKSASNGFATAIKEVLTKMLGISLLNKRTFLFFCFANLQTSLCSSVPSVYLPEKALEEGTHISDTIQLLTIMGTTNTFARLIAGWLADAIEFDKLSLYATAVTIGALFTTTATFTRGYLSLCVYASASGIAYGIQVTFTSLILVDINGLDKLSNSFGLVLMFRGIASLIGAPLMGKIVDASDSYTFCFAVAGGILTSGSIILWIVVYLEKKNMNRRKEDVVNDTSSPANENRTPNIIITLQGKIVDASDSYTFCFAVAGGILTSGSIILWIVVYLEKKNMNRRKEDVVNDTSSPANENRTPNIIITLQGCSNETLEIL